MGSSRVPLPPARMIPCMSVSLPDHEAVGDRRSGIHRVALRAVVAPRRRGGPTDAHTQPEAVVVLDKLTYAGNLANLDPVHEDDRLRFVEGDILDRALVLDLIDEVDAVVHFAAESHVDRSILGAADFVMTNVVGTQTLLDAALRRGIDKFVHVSTDEVYGSIDGGSWTGGQARGAERPSPPP